MNIVFTHAEYLWFLAAIPILILVHVLSLKIVRRKALSFANFEAIERVTGKTILSRNVTLLFFRLFILLLLVFSAAGTILYYVGYSSDFDFVLAIDASSSMLADDYSPNRLEVAKESALAFIDSLNSKTNVGVITFAGVTYLKQPITDNLADAKKAINEIGVEHAGGSAIGVAIQAGTNMLMESERSRVIIVLTDGQNNVGIDVDEAIVYANENAVAVHAIGVATKEGGTLSNINFISKLDEEALQHIAEKTSGKYYHAGSRQELIDSYKEIATSTRQKLQWKLGVPLMMLALMLLFLEWILQNTKYRTIP